MTQFIHVYAERTDGKRHPVGDVDGELLSAVVSAADRMRAIAHDNGPDGVASTLYVVEGASDEAAAFVDADAQHSLYDGSEAAQRALEMKPGTPTDALVDALASNLSDAFGLDIESTPPEHPEFGTSYADALRDEYPALEPGQYLYDPDGAAVVANQNELVVDNGDGTFDTVAEENVYFEEDTSDMTSADLGEGEVLVSEENVYNARDTAVEFVPTLDVTTHL